MVLHSLSLASLFIYSSGGKCPFHPLQWGFPHITSFTCFPAPGCWAGATTPAFSCWLVFLLFQEGLQLPRFSVLRAPCPLCYMSSLLFFFIIQFGFFLFSPWVGVGLSRGYADLAHCCLWEYGMPISSPDGLCLPKWSGTWCLAVGKHSLFFHLMRSGDAVHGLGVWRSQGFASSWWFFCKVYHQHLPKILF
jgi:hypothetical protein